MIQLRHTVCALFISWPQIHIFDFDGIWAGSIRWMNLQLKAKNLLGMHTDGSNELLELTLL